MQHSLGFLCDGFKNQFIALLAVIEVGKTNSASLGKLTFVKKRARELKRPDWIVVDETNVKSPIRGRLRGRWMWFYVAKNYIMEHKGLNEFDKCLIIRNQFHKWKVDNVYLQKMKLAFIALCIIRSLWSCN